jgi:hypothetical protein
LTGELAQIKYWHARCYIKDIERIKKPREDAMRNIITTTIAMLAAATPAFAATAGRIGQSGLFVWIFLGFCALIVVAQVVPAVLLIVGMVKGMVATKETAEAKVTAR